MRNELKEILYIHLNASDRFVLSSGISFQDFYYALSRPLQNILLLKHQYKDAEFNMHTLLEYVYQEDIPKLVKGSSDQTHEFCWIDFEDESGLSVLEGQELAELLYLGHCKNHLRPPFYRMLNNEFVYLSDENGWFNKVYYRSIDNFFSILGRVIPEKMSFLKVEKTWLGIRKKNDYPEISVETFIRLAPMMTEGIVISFEKVEQTRSRLEIPIWIIGDFIDTDEIAEGYTEQSVNEPDAKLIYIRKTKEWALIIK